MNLTVAGFLSALCLVLLGALAWEIAAPAPSVALEVATPAPLAKSALFNSVVQVPAAALLQSPTPSQTFGEISARSLFHPQRQAFPDSGMPGAALQPPQGVLIGVIISAAKSIAIVRPTDGTPTTSVVVGQPFQGWQLSKVDKAQAVFHSAQGEFTFTLQPPTAGGGMTVSQSSQVTVAPAGGGTAGPPPPASGQNPAETPSYLRKPTDPVPGMKPPSKTPLAIGNPL